MMMDVVSNGLVNPLVEHEFLHDLQKAISEGANFHAIALLGKQMKLDKYVKLSYLLNQASELDSSNAFWQYVENVLENLTTIYVRRLRFADKKVIKSFSFWLYNWLNMEEY
jgi:hypothetical protein